MSSLCARADNRRHGLEAQKHIGVRVGPSKQKPRPALGCPCEGGARAWAWPRVRRGRRAFRSALGRTHGRLTQRRPRTGNHVLFVRTRVVDLRLPRGPSLAVVQLQGVARRPSRATQQRSRPQWAARLVALPGHLLGPRRARLGVAGSCPAPFRVHPGAPPVGSGCPGAPTPRRPARAPNPHPGGSVGRRGIGGPGRHPELPLEAPGQAPACHRCSSKEPGCGPEGPAPGNCSFW